MEMLTLCMLQATALCYSLLLCPNALLPADAPAAACGLAGWDAAAFKLPPSTCSPPSRPGEGLHGACWRLVRGNWLLTVPAKT